VPTLPGSSKEPPPPARISLPSGAQKTFLIPLEDFVDVTNVDGHYCTANTGKEVYEIKVDTKSQTNRQPQRVLEISTIPTPGNRIVLASVVPFRQSSLWSAEVRLQDGTIYATIEEPTSGSYQIVKDGRKIYTIDGDSERFEVRVKSATTGQIVAMMEKGEDGYLGEEARNSSFLQLTMFSGDVPMALLAIVLAGPTLSQWPRTDSQKQFEATSGHFGNIIGLSTSSRQAPSIMSQMRRS
jgi:hypothetical protein